MAFLSRTLPLAFAAAFLSAAAGLAQEGAAPQVGPTAPENTALPPALTPPGNFPFNPGAPFGQPPRGFLSGANGNEDDGGGNFVRMEGGGFINEDLVRTAREVASHSIDHATGQRFEVPTWSNPPAFEKDVFTFARIVFKAGIGNVPGDYNRGKRIGWWVDFPDADLNLSYRLQQLTSTRTDPDGRVLKLTDPDLTNFPFIFMEHPGYMRLRDAELAALRKYLLNGGALVVIDFWNQREWDGFETEMARVLPGRKWTDIDTDHPLFTCVYDLRRPMAQLQVPTMQFWLRAGQPENLVPLTTDVRGPGSETMHVRAWLDDKDRIMAIAFHNTDISDGWEREGESDAYFRRFSEKISYPLGINILFYLMTH